MTIDEAIKELKDQSLPPELRFTSNFVEASQLGIEALKRILKERNMGAGADWGHLPGETNEGTARGARALLT